MNIIYLLLKDLNLQSLSMMKQYGTPPHTQARARAPVLTVPFVFMSSSGYDTVLIWKGTDVSEEHAASVFTLKMEAAWPSHISTRCHNPEDHNMNLRSREDLSLAVPFTILFIVISTQPL